MDMYQFVDQNVLYLSEDEVYIELVCNKLAVDFSEFLRADKYREKLSIFKLTRGGFMSGSPGHSNEEFERI
jgi:predicted house-cleaning noncanonical NTP pyrophosphatase (MazG superfamily)